LTCQVVVLSFHNGLLKEVYLSRQAEAVIDDG